MVVVVMIVVVMYCLVNHRKARISTSSPDVASNVIYGGNQGSDKDTQVHIWWTVSWMAAFSNFFI